MVHNRHRIQLLQLLLGGNCNAVYLGDAFLEPIRLLNFDRNIYSFALAVDWLEFDELGRLLKYVDGQMGDEISDGLVNFGIVLDDLLNLLKLHQTGVFGDFLSLNKGQLIAALVVEER